MTNVIGPDVAILPRSRPGRDWRRTPDPGTDASRGVVVGGLRGLPPVSRSSPNGTCLAP